MHDFVLSCIQVNLRISILEKRTFNNPFPVDIKAYYSFTDSIRNVLRTFSQILV
jgi:hypothetical protein